MDATENDALIEETQAAIIERLIAINRQPFENILRITCEDFARILAERTIAAGGSAGDWDDEDLQELLREGENALCGDGMPWAEVLKIAIDNATCAVRKLWLI